MAAARGFSETGLVRRWIEVLAFVGLWVAAGELLNMSPEIYLLFGTPSRRPSSCLFGGSP